MALVAVAEEDIGPFFLRSYLFDPKFLDGAQKGEVSKARAVDSPIDELNFSELGKLLGIEGTA
jgi:hypothetical protein